MGFLQGPITNIHRLDGDATPEAPESLAVIVPMAARDVDRPAAGTVLDAVSQLDPAWIAIPARGPREAIRRLSGWVESSYPAAEVLWCNGPELEAVCNRHDLPQQGKGSDTWLALGPAIETADTIAIVDADVTTATKEQFRRLVAPLAGDISATKAWYSRVERGQLYGRLCRLLVRPLVLAADRRWHDPFLSYMAAFRYPLSGEIAVDASIAAELRVPGGMGLEMGTLGELFELAGPDQVAQVDLGNHHHAHRPVTGDGGLVDIAPAVTGAFFDTLDRYGDIDVKADLTEEYVEWATRLVTQYERDATLNDLTYDAAAELAQIEEYQAAVSSPATVEWMPAWSSITCSPGTIREAGRPAEITCAD